MSTPKKPFTPRHAPTRIRFVATYTITKTVQIDAHDLEEAQREVDEFLAGIHGPTTIVSITRDS